MYSSSPAPTSIIQGGGFFPDPKWMPKAIDSTEPYIYCVFSPIHAYLWQKFNLLLHFRDIVKKSKGSLNTSTVELPWLPSD